MKVGNQTYRTIWLDDKDQGIVHIIDQRHLPHHFVVEDLSTVAQVEVVPEFMYDRVGDIAVTPGAIQRHDHVVARQLSLT